MAFTSVENLLRAAQDKPVWRAVQEDDVIDRGTTAEESWTQMSALWRALSLIHI